MKKDLPLILRATEDGPLVCLAVLQRLGPFAAEAMF